MTQETTALEEHIRFVGGGTPSRKRQEYYQGTIPWVTVKDLGEGLFLHDTQEKITPEAVKNSATNVIDSGHILVCTRMAVGKAVLTSKPVAINQDLKAIYHSEHLDTKFLLFYFRAKQSQLEAVATGATVKGITLDELRALQVPVLSIPQQRAIAQRLERADRLRRLRQHALDISDQYLQTVFLEMFGDPETNPSGWQQVEVGEVIALSQYGTSQKSNSEELGYPVIGMNHVTYSGRVEVNGYSHVELSRTDFESLRLRKGDVLFNRTNSADLVGKTAVWNLDLDAVPASYLIRIGLKESVTPEFFAVLLNTPHFKRMFVNRCKRAVSQANVSPTLLKEFVMYLPPRPLQESFSAVVHKHERLRQMQVEALRQASLLYETLLEEAFGEGGAG